MFEGVGGEGVEGFELGPGGEPGAHCWGVGAPPGGDGDGGLNSGGEEERERQKIAVAALLGDGELVLQAAELRDGSGGLQRCQLEALKFGAGEVERAEQSQALGEKANASLEPDRGGEQGRDFLPDSEAESGLDCQDGGNPGRGGGEGMEAEEARPQQQSGG